MSTLDGLETTLRHWGINVTTDWIVPGRPGSFAPAYVMVHHTAGPDTGPAPSRRVVRNGRPDLNGPLCNVLARRDMVAEIVSRGRANHAGEGQWGSIPQDGGNGVCLGIEIEHEGTDAEPWRPEFLAWLRVLEAACLDHLSRPATRLLAHKEYAPSRKIDPWRWSMSGERFKVATVLDAGPGAVAAPASPPAEGDDMYLAWNSDIPYLLDGVGKRRLSPTAAAELKTQTREAGRELMDLGAVSAGLLGEFPTYDETGNLSGSSYNDVRAALASLTQVRADLARVEGKLDALAPPPA